MAKVKHSDPVQMVSTLPDTQREVSVAVKSAGIHAYNGGNMPLAAELLSKAREQDPTDIELLIFLMRAAYRQGRWANAIAVAQDILGLKDNHQEALRVLARLYSRTNEIDLAFAAWRRLAEAVPGDREASLQLARLAFRMGAVDQAESWADRALGIDPSNGEALSIKTNVLLKRKDADGLENVLPRYFAHAPERALRALASMTSERTAEVCARIMKGIQRLAPGDEAVAKLIASHREQCYKWALEREMRSDDCAAARLFRALTTLDPDSQDATTTRRMRSYVLRALKKAQGGGLGDYSRAREGTLGA